jgi:hypothetical protein
MQSISASSVLYVLVSLGSHGSTCVRVLLHQSVGLDRQPPSRRPSRASARSCRQGNPGVMLPRRGHTYTRGGAARVAAARDARTRARAYPARRYSAPRGVQPRNPRSGTITLFWLQAPGQPKLVIHSTIYSASSQPNTSMYLVSGPRSAQIPPVSKSRTIFPYYLTGGIWADRGPPTKTV